MKLNSLMGLTGVGGILTGLVFMVLPEPALGIYGLSTDAIGLLITRYFGAAFFAFGLVIWFFRKVVDESEKETATLPLFFAALVGLLVSLGGQISGLVNPVGWAVVGVFAFFVLGYGLLQVRK